MSPWQLDDEKPETPLDLRLRYGFSTLFLSGAIISLFISPIAWHLFVLYCSLGLAMGILQTRSKSAALLALAILLIGVLLIPTWMERLAPHWYAAWWQPAIIQLGAAGLVHLMAFALRRRSAVAG